MPVMLTSFLLPSNTALPFLVQDIHLKGGLRCVKSSADRDAIKSGARSAGMMVWVSDDKQMYQLADDLTTWEDAKLGNNLVFKSPLKVVQNANNEQEVSLEDSQLIPKADQPGLVLTSGANGALSWSNFGGSAGAGARLNVEYSAQDFINPGENLNFTLDMSQTCMLLVVELNAFDIEIQFHTTDERNDRNPYLFRSTVDFLSDDGVTIEDNTIIKHRRYAFVSVPSGKTHYGVMRNLGSSPAQPKLSVTYLVME
ncbi:hypothetical protein HOU08_gp146 [Dickeya phage vB_DsoM_JA29]|uniref:Uncharacterized protein n=1 Tax=Dickeya phage vB_DsoM_JA29 TaxID=2283031 RepID=A0A384ZXA6_9CAUD|nr:hypothetical protein HOU08_gp146 [Dickeya phage vB_DsoM_JA29]AXG66872.1 hypothetical protein JA29_146 [Dickeya phage vB_DsoM_JA29]